MNMEPSLPSQWAFVSISKTWSLRQKPTMNKYKSRSVHIFYCPETLDILDVLPPELSHRADDARYLVSLVIYKAMNSMVDSQGFARLKADILNQVMDNRKRVEITKCLVRRKVIKCNRSYIVGERSLGYCLHPRFFNDALKTVVATDSRIIRRLDQTKLVRRGSTRYFGPRFPFPISHSWFNQEPVELGIGLNHFRRILLEGWTF